MAIIEVDHVSKEFRLGKVIGIRQTMRNAFDRLRGRPTAHRPLFKALDDVSFGVDQGEVVGIIGPNGAGKSTLLKILSRVTTPTSGRVAVHGKVAPLIEVGAGLNPELTGRENIFLNASILGVPRAEIKRKFDEIVAFSELDEFIDTPIKRYSSGMKVKLGFSIATGIEAEILIVDEVLAVGDLAFQRKCFDRMEDLIKGRGNTVLLVSHNIRQVERLCSRALLLDHGRIAAEGSARDVCELFYEQSNLKIAQQTMPAQKKGRSLRMSGEATLKSLEFIDATGTLTDSVQSSEALTIRANFVLSRRFEKAEVVFGFHTTDLVYISSMGTAHLESMPDLIPGENVIECKLDRLPLVPGVYALRVGVIDRNRREVFYGENLKVFAVRANAIPATRLAALGLVDIPAQWQFRNEHDTSPESILSTFDEARDAR